MNDAAPRRWAWAEIDSEAIAANVAHLAELVAPSRVWAVVKADGYGHGAVTATRAALAGGASGLCVALVQEGLELRAAGIETVPILVLSQQPDDQADQIVAARLTPTIYRSSAVAALAAAVARAGQQEYPVHLKIDTGMRRVGAQPDEALAVAASIDRSPELRLEGVFTHLAVADEPDDPFTAAQLERFEQVLAELGSAGIGVELVHAANSAGAIAHATARRDLVRVGIAAYGIEPGPALHDPCTELVPALRLVARVGHVKRVSAGERVSYGLRYRFEHDAFVATVPIGYADGVPRRLFAAGGEVLLGGHRRPIAGVVTMDQLMIDCGEFEPAVGDEVVLLGQQGNARIRPEERAERLGTIAYEIVCGVSRRIERRPLHR